MPSLTTYKCWPPPSVSRPGVGVRTSSRSWALNGQNHTAHSEVGNCLPLKDGKSDGKEHTFQAQPKREQTEGGTRPVRLRSHLLKPDSQQPVVWLKFKPTGNLGHLRCRLTPWETPSVSKVLTLSASHPLPQCASGRVEVDMCALGKYADTRNPFLMER